MNFQVQIRLKKLWFFNLFISLCFYLICLRWHAGISNKISHSFHEDKSHWTTKKVYTHNRKLLVHGKDSIVESSYFALHTLFCKSLDFFLNILITYILSSGSCTNRDISISQSKDSTSGIPQYIVQIVNTCVSGCAPSDIHLHCGWFASARVVNPRTFKRVSYDDCLVNGGMPLRPSQVIRFTYSNSFMYPIAFKSAKFCCA